MVRHSLDLVQVGRHMLGVELDDVNERLESSFDDLKVGDLQKIENSLHNVISLFGHLEVALAGVAELTHTLCNNLGKI